MAVAAQSRPEFWMCHRSQVVGVAVVVALEALAAGTINHPATPLLPLLDFDQPLQTLTNWHVDVTPSLKNIMPYGCH